MSGYRVFWCIDCDAWRTYPFCRVCDAKALYERALKRCERLYDMLPEKTQAEFIMPHEITAPGEPPRPKEPNTYGMSRKERTKALARHIHECEVWELNHYMRLYNNTKQQAYRIRKRLNDEKQ